MNTFDLAPSTELDAVNVMTAVQSPTSPAIATNGQVATAGLSVSRVNPAGAVTGITVQAGTVAGQLIAVVNEAVAANTLTLNTTPATANVADSATETAISGLTARLYVWDTSTALWYRVG